MFTSVKALFSSIVDYAGLFPPAKLCMREAMANYAHDHITSDNWMLGRFILPASRLHEFITLLPKFPLQQWSLGIILSGNVESELKTVQSLFNSDKIAIAALEFPPLPPNEIESLFTSLCTGVETFFEVPSNANLEAYLAVVQHTNTSAKIRTGGITIDAFPNLSQLSHYIASFAETQISFKATAGLHHALPGKYPLTYEPDSDFAQMHGFLNVAIAAVLAYYHKVTREEIVKILKEPSLNNFYFSEDEIGWKSYRLNLSEIEKARQHFFRSFGSCSFLEPIEDLKMLQ